MFDLTKGLWPVGSTCQCEGDSPHQHHGPYKPGHDGGWCLGRECPWCDKARAEATLRQLGESDTESVAEARQAVIDAFNDSAAMPGNEAAFTAKLDVLIDLIRGAT